MDPAMLASFAAAARGLHDPSNATRAQAEQALLQFRRSAGVEAAVAVLQQSHDEGVQFQAVLALREILLTRWAVVGQAAQQGTLQFLLSTALAGGMPAQSALRRQVHGTVAAIIKRGWLESAGEEQAAPLRAIHAQSAAAGTADARRVGLQLLAAVVEEFSPTTASTMGLSWEVHERCRESFEDGFLHGLLVHALGCAREAAPAAVAGADGGVCAAAVALLTTIFSWSFSRASGSSVWRVLESGRPSAVTGGHLRPPASWRDALLAPDGWAWLAQLAQATTQLEFQQQASPGSPALALINGINDLVRQLAGLSGDVLGPAAAPAARAELGLAPQASLREQHLQTVLRMLLPWVSPPGAAVEAAARDERAADRLWAASEALAAAAAVHRLAGFEAAAAALGGGGGGVLDLLSQLTTAAVGSHALYGDPDSLAEVLLEAWVELVADPCHGPLAGSEAAARGAAGVFGAVVAQGLRQAAEEALEDEEEVEGGEGLQSEERLARIAALGRASAPHSLPLLAEQLQGCLAALQAAARAGADPSVALEQLCWLVALSGHVLADAGDGETPLVPLAVAQACQAAADGGAADPAERLSGGLLAVGAHCLAHAGQTGSSPRLMEVSAGSLARWADTYLMPDEAPGSPALAAAFGAGSGGGDLAAQLLVSVALAGLTRYPGERALHEVVCARLLAALVRRRSVCALLPDAPAWHALCEAVGRGDAGLLQLEGRVQRLLLRSLLLAAKGWPGDAAGWAAQLLESAAAQLRAAGAGEAAARAALARADGAHLVASLLERQRGAARGTLPPTQAALFAQFTSVAPALAALFGAAAAHTATATLVLKLAADVVEAHAASLAPPAARALCGWALQLVEAYAATSRGQVTVSASQALAAEALGDRYREHKALLKLLTRLTQADWGDALGGGPAPADAVDVAQIVFAGLDSLVPLLSPQLLQFPKLCRAFFSLLAHVLEVYPERMAAQPPAAFQTLLSSLRWGVGATGDEEVTQAVFEAAAALARHHVTALAAGQPGLGANNAPGADGTTPLGALLHAALQRLVVGDAGLEAVDHAAEAVLPLALADPPALRAAGEGLLAACADGTARASAQAAFGALVAQVGEAASLDRPSRRAFAKALLTFVADAKGAVHVR